MLEYLNEREEPDEAARMLAQDVQNNLPTAGSILANGSSGPTLAEQVFFEINLTKNIFKFMKF